MPAHSAHRFPGPEALGRGAVVAGGAEAPQAFAAAPRVVIDDDVLTNPRAAADVVHRHWLDRRRMVVELAASNDALRAPELTDRPPYTLPDDFVFDRERLHVLMWANSYDCRRPDPRWWHGVLARRHAGAGVSHHADVTLPDGRDAWVDGGPRGPVPLAGADAYPVVHRESVSLGRLTVASADAPSVDLAPDQLDAVRHGHGPARVIAPAGSGKTRVLTARLRHLLVDRRVEPELVTALAYNTRAAAQLRARTAGLPASIRTLHSLALWICSLDERRRVIDEREVRGILDDLVATARIPNQDPYQPYLEALSEVRLALRDPAEVEAVRGDVDDLPRVFAAYRQVLADQRLLDFDEQIYRAIEVLLQRPDLRMVAQRAGTHLLVDEFQDLTPAFLLLVRLVAGPTNQVFAVGDDDQTIYSYAGATPDFLVDFTRWFPGATSHALEVNYRCPPAVVGAAANLLAHNHHRVPKTIRPVDGHRDDGAAEPDGAATTADGDDAPGAGTGPAGRRAHLVAPEAMAGRVLTLVQEHLATGAPAAAFAVLARVNSALLPVQVVLTEHGIPHGAPLDAGVLNRTGVRTALAYLRLGTDLERIRRDDLLDTLNRPARKVKSALLPLLPSGRRFTLGQLEAIVPRLDATNGNRLAGYLADLRHLEAAITEGADTAACLGVIRTRIGLGEAMDALDASRSRPEGSSHGDDLDALEQLAGLHPDPAGFRDWLRAALEVPGDPTGVTLATVHRVKGMEWPRVVVFAATQGLFPHRLADDLEEERRVFHVALTRCATRVDIVADRARPSPFIEELTATPPSAEQRAERAAAEARRRGGAASRPRRTADDRLVDVPEDDLDPVLFEALRGWRSRQAAQTGVPAYLVFHDRHLRIITARRPTSLAELAACPGVGPTKLDRYGDDLLALIGDHAG